MQIADNLNYEVFRQDEKLKKVKFFSKNFKIIENLKVLKIAEIVRFPEITDILKIFGILNIAWSCRRFKNSKYFKNSRDIKNSSLTGILYPVVFVNKQNFKYWHNFIIFENSKFFEIL